MVLKKELIDELKKYNTQLEKHLGGVDFGFIAKTPELFAKDDGGEFYALMGSNLIDIRTELALIRKNFATDIENMVQTTISNQQDQFLGQVNKLYSQVIMDLKNNFSGYIKDMNSEISGLKKEFVKISVQNTSFDKRLDEFRSDIIEFKSFLIKLDSSISNFSKKDVNDKLDLLDTKIDTLTDTSISKINLVQKNLLNLNQKIVGLEKTNSDFSEDFENLNSNFLKTQVNSKIIKSSKNLIDGGKKVKDNLKKIVVDPSNIDRILEIDSRIRNLESLK